MARRKSKGPEVIKQIEGQIAVWDLDLTEKEEKKIVEEVIEEIAIKNENLKSNLNMTEQQLKFLEKYKIMESKDLSRVTLSCGGGVLIEMINKDSYQTMYLNRDGINECVFNKRIALVPMDKIIYYKNEVKPNEIQEEKLLSIQDQVTRVIKRKGDENIIAIAAGKVISINKQGWALEYKGVQAIYADEEVRVKTATAEITNEEFKIGESVDVEFDNQIYKGVITRIYNGGDTINCIFDNKHTAFHISKVKKINVA
ncbi:MAG: hypothetical protein RR844_09815 [Clostridium sp.]